MPAPETRQKVFVIGFHKTGTTTMGLALDILGYRVTGPDLDLAEAVAKGDWSAIEPRLEAFDAFQDSPWYLLYEGLHARYPEARFILTTRPPDRWLASVKDHFGHRVTPMRRHIYGDRPVLGNEAHYEAVYRAHNAAVLEHFAGHPGFLAIDLGAGVTWQTLCDFLGEEVPKDWRGRPAVELPRTNTRGGRELRARWPGIYRARDRARRLVYRVLGPRLGDSVRSLYSSVVYRARRR